MCDPFRVEIVAIVIPGAALSLAPGYCVHPFQGCVDTYAHVSAPRRLSVTMLFHQSVEENDQCNDPNWRNS
jgi:hypothetical protein